MVVDDIAINREIAAGFLRFAGHQVVGADSGAAAIELAKTEDFDLILMDVLMPGMDGLEATRRIRALAPPRGLAPIVALSAQAFAEQIEKCRQAGMTEHISKPFEQANLIAVVERVAAEPERQHLANLPVAGRVTEAPVENTLLDRDVMANMSALLLPGNVTKHFVTLIVLAEALLDDLLSIEGGRRAKLAADAHRLGAPWACSVSTGWPRRSAGSRQRSSRMHPMLRKGATSWSPQSRKPSISCSRRYSRSKRRRATIK